MFFKSNDLVFYFTNLFQNQKNSNLRHFAFVYFIDIGMFLFRFHLTLKTSGLGPNLNPNHLIWFKINRIILNPVIFLWLVLHSFISVQKTVRRISVCKHFQKVKRWRAPNKALLCQIRLPLNMTVHTSFLNLHVFLTTQNRYTYYACKWNLQSI